MYPLQRTIRRIGRSWMNRHPFQAEWRGSHDETEEWEGWTVVFAWILAGGIALSFVLAFWERLT